MLADGFSFVGAPGRKLKSGRSVALGCMARPRVHDFDQLLDAAERLAVESGPAAVTVRALSERAGVSNGAIYHAFGSRAGLVGQVWLRAARRFLAMQVDWVEATFETVLEAGPGSAFSTGAAVDAVVVAADTPARFTLDHPASGRFPLTVSCDHLLGSADLPRDLAADLQDLDRRLADPVRAAVPGAVGARRPRVRGGRQGLRGRDPQRTAAARRSSPGLFRQGAYRRLRAGRARPGPPPPPPTAQPATAQHAADHSVPDHPALGHPAGHGSTTREDHP